MKQSTAAAAAAADGSTPACGSKTKGEYNTPLHVFALVLILVLSTAACAFPIIVRRFPRLPVPHHFLFLSRHFGTGVLIATAFVHLLPTAFTSLTDPCLPAFWNQGYPAMAGLIAMTAVFVVVGIEMFFASRGAGHVHGSDYDTLGGGGAGGEAHGHAHGHASYEMGNGRPRSHGRSTSFNRFKSGSLRPGDGDDDDENYAETDNLVAGVSPSIPPPTPSPAHAHTRIPLDDDEEAQTKPIHGDDSDSDSDLDLPELDYLAPGTASSTDASGLLNGAPSQKYRNNDTHNRQSTDSTHHHHSLLTPTQQQRKQLLQCLLLEAGILFHSIFIGMAISVATGPPFLVLLVAISFHQTFEGLALGSRIAALAFPARSPKPWLMALAYGTTTPLGQAVGLGIHGLYDPASETGLLTVGVMNAVSSGLLLFAGLVELLAEDFLSDASYQTLRGGRRLQACAAVVAGGGLMALVGAWA
ncbi:zip family zinc transporter [Diplodia corticola]|uniref:Zip family zinc transporter n=1 Tax=Diplodia corticola TaxID=236234 RepID=A0A1J9RMM4_9PEZI|nr:zip family zinc transporter [Diplodia corticola]OJD28853.1 zip family zinc transporter [Diplodia corticola]